MNAAGQLTDSLTAVMPAADRARWITARTLADLGELVAQWLEGRIGTQPGYDAPVDVDDDLAPGLAATLAALNRAGFVTASSQAGFAGPGFDGAWWEQRAAVRGFADADTLAWLRQAFAGTRFTIRHGDPRRVWPWSRPRVPVTRRAGQVRTDFGNRMPDSDIADPWVGYGVCHPTVVDALRGAYQIVLFDPEYGRNDLWPLLSLVLALRAARAARKDG